MNNLLISGSSGKLGLYVRKLAKDYGFDVVCGVDANNFCDADFPVYKTFSEVKENVDAIIDFSSPSLALSALCFARENAAAIVCGTTALKAEFYEQAKIAAKKIPVCVDSNFSRAVHVFADAAQSLSQKLYDFDKALIETHNAKKKDSPSGTALFLSEKTQIKQICSIRGGNVCGEHKIVFMGDGEQIEIIHRATDKSVFAKGALKAAKFLLKEKVGFFSADQALNIRALNI